MSSYIRIKLDKLAAGDQKRLFKSSKQVYDQKNITQSNKEFKKHIISQKTKQSQIFYGKYSNQLKLTNLLNNFNSQLIQFYDVYSNYINYNQKINFKQYIDINSYYSKLFEQNQTNKAQLIQYFKSILQMPIDIVSVQNVAYLLSPLSNRKNVQMVASQFNVNYKDFKIQADYKENYNKLFNYILSKPVQCPEREGIPIYDLNFTDIETITFQTKQKLQNWLTTYKFNTMVYEDKLASSYITCNIHNKFEQYNDSVNIQKLFIILLNSTYNSLNFTTQSKKQLLTDLLDNLNEYSMNCKISPIGTISKISNKTKSLYINNNLLLNTINQNKDTAIQMLTRQQKDFYTKNNIPHNTLYLLQLLNPLEFNQNESKSQCSAYFNFVNLKNMQTPLQDFQVTIPDINNTNFNIYGNQKNILDYTSGIFKNDIYKDPYNTDDFIINNKDTINLYDIDKTKSLQFNNVFSQKNNVEENYSHRIPNVFVTSSILMQSIIYDQKYRNDNQLSADYVSIDSHTLQSKFNNYLIPFYQRHIEDNKQLEIGQVNGLRSYIKSGVLDDQKNIWLTYKYVTSKSNIIEEIYSQEYELPFQIYQIDRYNQHMLQNEMGIILYQKDKNTYISKQIDTLCPYKYIHTNNITVGCSCLSGLCSGTEKTKCQGFCTFPIYKKYLETDIPTGLYWSNNQYLTTFNKNYNNISNQFSLLNDNWFYFIPLNVELDDLTDTQVAQIYADTDIFISDDIEIYFSNLLPGDFMPFINVNGPFYDSIFRGFGHQGDTDYKYYLLRNNENIEKIYDIKHRHISSYFTSIQEYTNRFFLHNQNMTIEQIFDRPLYYFIDEKYMENLENRQIYNQIFNTYFSKIFYLPENAQYKKILQIKSFYFSEKAHIKDIEYLNDIDNNITYYDLYTKNLANYILDLVLDSKTKIKLKDMPFSNQIIKTKLLYNNFRIAQNSPFNGPHIINANTLLNGLIISKTDANGNYEAKDGQTYNIYKTDEIPKNYYCYIRVINWWSNSIQCTGKIKVKNKNKHDQQLYNNILNTINSYDYIQLIDGFFKSAQKDFKKSNIYSLKIENSGLNPNNDKIFSDFYQCLLIKNYSSLNQQYKQFYDFIDMNKFNELQYQNYKNILNITLIERLYYTNIDEKIDIVKEYKSFFEQDKLNGYFDIQKNKNQSKYKESKCYKYINGCNGIYILNKQKLQKYLNIRKELRQIFQTAIKNSVNKYMPVYTDLWKIMYIGK